MKLKQFLLSETFQEIVYDGVKYRLPGGDDTISVYNSASSSSRDDVGLNLRHMGKFTSIYILFTSFYYCPFHSYVGYTKPK
jgi:hypothetical protein